MLYLRQVPKILVMPTPSKEFSPKLSVGLQHISFFFVSSTVLSICDPRSEEIAFNPKDSLKYRLKVISSRDFSTFHGMFIRFRYLTSRFLRSLLPICLQLKLMVFKVKQRCNCSQFIVGGHCTYITQTLHLRLDMTQGQYMQSWFEFRLFRLLD